jgi:amino acid adenylation domain-containing protein
MSNNNIEDIYTLSPLQEGLLFHSLYSTESDTYLQQLRFSIRGELNVSAFEHAWQQVIARHTILRTAFVWDRYEKLFQAVRKQVKLPWRELDCRALDAEEQQRYLATLLEEDRRQGFDLSKAPLLRLTVIRFADESYELFCTLHHLLTDGWSTANLIKELFAFYNAACEGRELILERPRPYRDYIEWLQQQDPVEAELFWRDLLKGFAAPTPLIGEAEPAGQSDREQSIEIQRKWLSRETTAKLQAWARQSGITMNTLVVGTWAILLSRYSNEQDVLFGITVAGRPASLTGVEAMIGPFINTLPLRVQLPPDARLLPWLESLQTRLLETYEYQYSPLTQVQRFSDVPRGVPLFESMVVFENYPLKDAEQGLSRHLESVSIKSLERSNYPLGFIAAPGPKLYLQIGYDSRRFSFETISRMLGHLEVLLENMSANPDQPIAGMSLLTSAEQEQLLVSWNQTGNQVPVESCLHHLFEEQVEQTPDAIAVICEAQRLTYRDLNNRANQLAHYLRDQLVGTDEHVGICCERSLEMIVGILGILKAGAAYVPMDPGQPSERLRYILKDAQIRLLLTEQALLEKISGEGTQVKCLDADWELISGYYTENPHTEVTPDNTAYVIYTSGSTGQPKGVMIPHSGICNTLLWRRKAFLLSNTDRIFQNLSFAFDASVWQIFGALLNGAQLVLARPDDHRDPAYLVKAMIEYGITITDFPPAMLQALLNEPGIEQWRTLRHLFCGGDVMRAELPEQFYAKLNAELHNVYGPTETAVDATCWTCRRKEDRLIIPIGRPISNKQIYLLDSQLQPAPVGIEGEICISGSGLARGYLNHPAATSEKFIPHPFSSEPGARLYRTGDIARFLPDGNLEFIGRNDGQVKIRGFRLELGEVEAALLEHNQVAQAVAVAREHAPGEKRLVAYVVPRREATLTSAELSRHLQDRLPPYMVPSAFVQMESLPLTTNGKVDRGALPAPEFNLDKTSYTAPRNTNEETLCKILAKVLRIEQVGVYDNFFELGGDSILSIQVCVQAREEGLHLAPKHLFDHPTVAALATVATNGTGIWDKQDLVSGEAGGHTASDFQLASLDQQTLTELFGPKEQIVDLYPLSPMQEGLLFHWLYAPESKAYFLQASWRLLASLDVSAFRRAWQTVFDRHAILRTTFLWEGLSKPLQAVHETLEPEWIEEDWRKLSVEEQAASWKVFLRRDSERGFDLSKGPLTRLALMRTGAESYLFAWSTHHILLDGWSNQFLMSEVFTLYEAYRQGKELQLPRPPRYRDYIAWLLQQDLGKAEAFWREELNGFTEPTSLGIDRSATGLSAGKEEIEDQTLWLSEEVTSRLESLARAHKVTLNNVVQGAWGVLLSRYSGTQDVVFGSTSSGRSAGPKGIEAMVGLFINTLPVRVQVKPDESLRTYLKDVQIRQSRAHEFEYTPLTQIQSWNETTRGKALFESLVVFQNHPMDAPLSQAGSSVQIKEAKGFDRTHYPLALTVNPGRRLRLMLEYDCRRFEGEHITRLLGHLQKLLEEMAREPDRRVGNLPLLSKAEWEQMLRWNHTATKYSREKCLHKLFEQQVERTPEAVAVVYEREELSYEELNRKANELAHYLRKQGVGPEVRVGLCVKRSPEMVVGLLGILKAGGAYVPLDSDYPRERLAFMLEDAQVKVLLTQEKLKEGLPKNPALVVCLDSDWNIIAREQKSNPEIEAIPENLAYVIYTSGSTGKPKGVMVQHSSVVNYIESGLKFSIIPEDKVLQFASISFDAAAEEIFSCLTRGAQLVLRTDAMLSSASMFLQQCHDLQLTVLGLPTAYWHYLTSALADEELSLPASVRLVIIGGEKALPEMFTTWQQQKTTQKIELLNTYGPTETTIGSTACLLSELDRCIPVSRELPIGRPVANTQVYVLDQHMQPVPVGIPGQLYIGGECLARGYINNPVVTSLSFIPHPFSSRPGDRLYKSGDVVRFLPDGNLEFLGRSDHQVKIRGFRIELGEIEAMLETHPAVGTAIAVTNDDSHREKRLVAYVVRRGGVVVTTAELRDYMQTRVPPYMVPAVVMILEELPLTVSGKIDRRALPPPEDVRIELKSNFVAARDFVEVLLVRIWEKVLGIKHVGVKDDFFDLGGHSILALRLAGEIKKQFGRDLPLAILFEKRTIERLAEALNQQFETLPNTALVPIQPLGTKRPLFFVHVGSGQVLCYLELARYLGTDQPFYGLQDVYSYDANDSGSVREIAIEKMAAHYIDSLKEIQPEGPYFLGGWSFGGVVAYEMATQLMERGEEVPLLILLDTVTPDFIRELKGIEDDVALLAILAHEMGLPVTDSDLRPLEAEEQLRYVTEQMEKAHIIFDDSLAYLKHKLALSRMRVRVMDRYRPKPYSGRIIFFSAGDMDGEADEKERASKLIADPTRGFRELSTDSLELYTIPAAHHTIARGESARIMAEMLSARISHEEEKVLTAV